MPHSPLAEREEYFGLGANVLDGGSPGANLSPEDVVEDLHRVLLPLKVDPVHVAEQQEQEARVVHLLAQLGQHDVRLLFRLVAEEQGLHVHHLLREVLLRLLLLLPVATLLEGVEIVLEVADDLSRVLGRFAKYPLHLSSLWSGRASLVGRSKFRGRCRKEGTFSSVAHHL